MSAARARSLALLALVVAVAATFAEALFSARVFFQRDVLSYWYPGMEAFRRAIAQGAWPLWNPSAGFGSPLLADASFQLAYPPTWLALLLPLEAQYKLFVVGHAVFGGVGGMLLARRLGQGWAAAGAAGGAYALAGPYLSAASLFHHYAGASWMPWVLAALETLLRRPGLRSCGWLAAAGGGQLLAGSGDLCLMTGVSGGLRLLVHLVGPAREARAAGAFRTIGLAAAAALLAACVGAVQWLPTAEQASRGARPSGELPGAYWSVHPLSLGDLVVPRLTTSAPLSGAARQALFEGRASLLACLYLGAGTLVFATLGLRSRQGRLAWAGALLWTVASLGRHTWLSFALLKLPGFALMRYPQKFLLPAALCFALAAGAGVQVWLEAWDVRARWAGRRFAAALAVAAGVGLACAAWVAAGGSPLAALFDPAAGRAAGEAAAARLAGSGLALALGAAAIAWRGGEGRPRVVSAVLALALGLAGLDLVLAGRSITPLAPPGLTGYRPALVAGLRPLAGTSRVQFLSRQPECSRVVSGPPGWDPAASGALAALEVLRPPAGARWGLDGAFDGEFTGLEPLALRSLVAAAREMTGSAQGTQLLEVANVAHVLFVGKGPLAGLEPVARVASSYACPAVLLRVPDPLPRAYVVGAERILPGSPDDWAAILAPGFDPRRDVWLAGAEGVAAGPAPGPTPSGAPRLRPARVLARRVDGVEVEAELDEPGVLVLVEAYDPGWRALVDGRPAPVLRANVLFRGVRLAAGRHRVRFEYRPRSAGLGLGLSLAGAVAVAGLVGWRGRLNPLRAGATIASKREDTV